MVTRVAKVPLLIAVCFDNSKGSGEKIVGGENSQQVKRWYLSKRGVVVVCRYP